MKKAVLILFLIILSGCGGPAPTATPNLNTPAGYRQGAVSRAERAANIINVAQSLCATGSIEECQRALKTQKDAYAKTPDLAPLGGRPLVCDQIASNYFILIDSGQDYFKQANTSAAQNDQAALRQTAKERMMSFNQSWTAFNNALPNDPCQ